VIDVSEILKYVPKHYQSDFAGSAEARLTVQKALPLLADGASAILNASVVGSKGLSPNSVYSVIKATLRSFAQFARTWTTDLGCLGPWGEQPSGT
jgi:hypothetical protein